VPDVHHDSTGDWIELAPGLSVKTPEPSPALLEKYTEWNKQAIEAWHWNRQEGRAGVDLPSCRGDSLDVVAIDSAGFYYKYRIEKVFYFPSTGYILIFTHNDRYAGEFDSENGYLLLRRRVNK